MYVIVPKIEAACKSYSLKQIQQLYTIIKKTGYYDCHPDNVINGKNGIAYIIDTEERSFTSVSNNHALYNLNNLNMEFSAKEWLRTISRQSARL